MRRSLVCFALTGAVSLIATGVARADLIYGFETGDTAGPTDGFSPGQFGTGPVTQSNVGVTQGSNSLEVLPAQNTYYTQGAFAVTNYVPTAFTLATSATYSLTVDGTQFGGGVYGEIYPTFNISTPGQGASHFLVADPNSQTNLGGKTFNDTSILLNLAVFQDPDGANDGAGTAAVYTVGRIVVNDSNYEGVTYSVGAFQLDFQDSGTADGSSVPFYLDDFETAPTPEPASLGLVGLGGIAMMRRRRSKAR